MTEYLVCSDTTSLVVRFWKIPLNICIISELSVNIFRHELEKFGGYWSAFVGSVHLTCKVGTLKSWWLICERKSDIVSVSIVTAEKTKSNADVSEPPNIRVQGLDEMFANSSQNYSMEVCVLHEQSANKTCRNNTSCINVLVHVHAV